MYRKLSLVLVALVLFLTFAMPVGARKSYCSADPVFEVSGRQVKVVVELAPYEIKDSITRNNAVQVVLTAPLGTNPQVVDVFGEFPEMAAVQEDDQNKVSVNVRVPQVEGFEGLRVTVYVDGAEVRQHQTGAYFARVIFPWL